VPASLILRYIADLEISDPIEIILRKARPALRTTLVILLVALRIFGYGVNAIIGSADQLKPP